MVPAPPVRRRLVGRALRRYRENLGYTLSDAARVLECHASKVSRIENGERGIRAKELREITLGLRPGELRKLAWDHVELDRGVVHVWRSASATGDTKTPQSKRSLILPKRAVTAVRAHKAMQDREREAAGESWQGTNLVFCHEDGSMCKSEPSTGASPG